MKPITNQYINILYLVLEVRFPLFDNCIADTVCPYIAQASNHHLILRIQSWTSKYLTHSTGITHYPHLWRTTSFWHTVVKMFLTYNPFALSAITQFYVIELTSRLLTSYFIYLRGVHQQYALLCGGAYTLLVLERSVVEFPLYWINITLPLIFAKIYKKNDNSKYSQDYFQRKFRIYQKHSRKLSWVMKNNWHIIWKIEKKYISLHCIRRHTIGK